MITTASFVFIGCPTYIQWSRSLPNGYRVIYTDNSSAFIIDAAGRDVAGPGVRSWEVSGDFTTGVLKDGEWFVINTSSGDVQQFENEELAREHVASKTSRAL